MKVGIGYARVKAMRLSSLKVHQRGLARGAALFLIGGMAAGCSSGTVRFGDGVDGIFTSSTANQRSIIKPQDQPYPGDAVQSAPAATSYSTSGARNAVEPVDLSRSSITKQELAPVATAARSEPSRRVEVEPMRTASIAPAPAKVDRTVTGTVPSKPASAAVEDGPAGWSRAGGTQVTIREGETVYNLSRRFGVPANVIMRVNGLSSASGLQAGQKVVIPTYVYSRSAPVSAPDSDPNVREAKSSRGTRYDVPAGKAPVPSHAPSNKVAVLPETPKVREEKPMAAKEAPRVEAKATPADGYTVQQGDTLSAIARKTGVSVADLKRANGMNDGFIRIGQTLTVPQAGNVRVVSAEQPAKVDGTVTGTAGPARKASSEEVAGYTPPKKDEKVIEAAEKVAAVAPDSTGIDKMRWPARGRVITAYGSRNGAKANDGIDISVPEGTPIKAAENGVVIYAGDGLKEFGNTVLVRHEDGLVTVYGHASKLEVSRGDKVKRGEEIALSGMSGTADSPRLHFEVRKDSAPVDPTKFLE
jgi:murein DD-endopeptidase MepM/ murein hydrolase activator NlpD